jgi:hypothetical protein
MGFLDFPIVCEIDEVQIGEQLKGAFDLAQPG